jgi:predicted TIM-barrel fold metal-dependent hydrolase
MVIDFHAHVYPEKIAARAVDSIGEFYKIPMRGKGTPEGLLESGRTNGGGIDRFVVFSAAAIPGQVESINNYIAGVVREHPECTGFGTLHRDFPDPGAEIDRIIGMDLKGLKFHPDMQRFNIDDDRMMEIYALLEGRLPVVFHTGDYRYSWSHPARLARVLDRFPGLTAVAAHFGGWSVFDLALEYLKDRFCYFDVSSSLPYLGNRRAEELIRLYGAERFLFGSDYPMWNPLSCLDDFMKLRLSSAEQEFILYKNALRILKEETGAHDSL